MPIILGIVAITSLITAVASIAFCCWMIARIYTSHLPAQVAATIAKQVEETVKSRVKITNDLLRGKEPEQYLGEVEEAPVPSFLQTGSTDDLHEINRELSRYKNRDEDRRRAVRDVGIGVEDI